MELPRTRKKKFLLVVFASGFVSVLILTQIESNINTLIEIKSLSFVINENTTQCLNQPSKFYQIFESEIWQVLRTTNGTFKMYNAYYDDRKNLSQGPAIKIIAFLNMPHPKVQTFCQLWYDGIKDPLSSRTFEYTLMWAEYWGTNQLGSTPFIVSCLNPLVDQGLVPVAVALVENECDLPTNKLKVNYSKLKSKKPFAVCVKDLDYNDDHPMRFIEWIEILSLVGAEKIFIYVLHAHTNIMKVLQFYETQGKVKIEKMTRLEGLNVTQGIQEHHNDMISFNDCLYKHYNEFYFLLPLDIDEIILPVKPEEKLLNEVLSRLGKDRSDGYGALNAYFLLDNNHAGEIQPEVSSDLMFLQHVYRSKDHLPYTHGPKSFQSTEKTLVMHNHWPLHCIGKSFCDVFYMPVEDAQLQHYKRRCEGFSKKECDNFEQNTVEDKTLWKYKDEIIANVNKTLEGLRHFQSY